MSDEKEGLTADGVPFGSLGRATRADARAVWNSMPNPTLRPFISLMERRGWKCALSTMQKWSKDGFADKPPGKNPKKPVDIAKKVNRKVNETIEKITETAALKDNETIAKAVEFAGSKIDDLVKLSHEELKKRLDILTMAVSIVALEQFADKLPALVLMPRDSGAFISSIAEVSTAMVPPGEPKPGDGKGGANAVVVEGQAVTAEKPQTLLSQKIAQFRKEQGLVVVR